MFIVTIEMKCDECGASYGAKKFEHPYVDIGNESDLMAEDSIYDGWMHPEHDGSDICQGCAELLGHADDE